MIGNDGIEHAHTAFVENTHDRFVGLQLFGERLTELTFLATHFDFFQRRNMLGFMGALARFEPLF